LVNFKITPNRTYDLDSGTQLKEDLVNFIFSEYLPDSEISILDFIEELDGIEANVGEFIQTLNTSISEITRTQMNTLLDEYKLTNKIQNISEVEVNIRDKGTKENHHIFEPEKITLTLKELESKTVIERLSALGAFSRDWKTPMTSEDADKAVDKIMDPENVDDLEDSLLPELAKMLIEKLKGSVEIARDGRGVSAQFNLKEDKLRLLKTQGVPVNYIGGTPTTAGYNKSTIGDNKSTNLKIVEEGEPNVKDIAKLLGKYIPTIYSLDRVNSFSINISDAEYVEIGEVQPYTKQMKLLRKLVTKLSKSYAELSEEELEIINGSSIISLGGRNLKGIIMDLSEMTTLLDQLEELDKNNSQDIKEIKTVTSELSKLDTILKNFRKLVKEEKIKTALKTKLKGGTKLEKYISSKVKVTETVEKGYAIGATENYTLTRLTPVMVGEGQSSGEDYKRKKTTVGQSRGNSTLFIRMPTKTQEGETLAQYKERMKDLGMEHILIPKIDNLNEYQEESQAFLYEITDNISELISASDELRNKYRELGGN
tara:strand:+ start:16190 stop:17812 length:1623 start_codon:yes stop_codon:yes gene_type:complete